MTTALVTGASSGIGLAFARRLAADGHDLVLVARSADRLQALAAELEAAHGVQVEVLVADLTDRAQLEQVAQRLRAPERPVEILVNNAGLGQRAGFVDQPLQPEEDALDLMVRAVLVLSHAAAVSMRERGRGAILNVSSVAAHIVMGTYSAAKSWVLVFTEGLAGELRGSGVTATAVLPGMTRTEFHARAGMTHIERLPDPVWSLPEQVVDEALAAARRGATVCVPGRHWAVMSSAVQLLPRPVTRVVSTVLARTGLSGVHG